MSPYKPLYGGDNQTALARCSARLLSAAQGAVTIVTNLISAMLTIVRLVVVGLIVLLVGDRGDRRGLRDGFPGDRGCLRDGRWRRLPPRPSPDHGEKRTHSGCPTRKPARKTCVLWTFLTTAHRLDHMQWDRREAVILAALAEMDRRGDMPPETQTVVVATGLGEGEAARGLLALREAEYISGRDVGAELMGFMYYIQLTERGRRATGLWPSDDSATAFLALIEARIAETIDPEERSRWQRLREAVTNLGTESVKQLPSPMGSTCSGLASTGRASDPEVLAHQ